jgi:hypothetical protein
MHLDDDLHTYLLMFQSRILIRNDGTEEPKHVAFFDDDVKD